MFRKVLVTASATTLLVVGLSGAAPSANAASVNTTPPGWTEAQGGTASQGVGFCLSQVAQHPEYDDVANFGAAHRAINAVDPGSIPDHLAGARYPECGGPDSGP